MRVEFDEGVFAGAHTLRHLLNLLHCFADGRHDWVVNPETLRSAERYLTEHAPSLAKSSVLLGEKAMVDAAWGAGAITRPDVQIELESLEDISDDLCRAAVLVVEDLINDTNFIKSLCHVFGAERIQLAIEQGWLEIRHAGGARLVPVAEEEARKYKRHIRVVALLDSDRLLPGEETLSHKKAAALKACGVTAYVLELREAENYVPNRILFLTGRRRHTSAKLDLLKRLTSEQRGFYDMKIGFGNPNGSPVVKVEQAALYAGLSRPMLVGLQGGFGGKVLECLSRNYSILTEQDFEKIDPAVPAELKRLLKTIESVI